MSSFRLFISINRHLMIVFQAVGISYHRQREYASPNSSSSDHPGWLVRRSQQPPTSAHWAQSQQFVGNIYYRFGASALFMREKLGGGTLSTPNRLAPPLPADRGHLDDTAVRINRHCRNDRRPWHRSLLSFAREVVSDHGSADFGSASVRMDYARGVVF